MSGQRKSNTTLRTANARGVNPGTEDSYSASNANTQIFDMAFLKIDSDQAVETAQKHGETCLPSSLHVLISSIHDLGRVAVAGVGDKKVVRVALC